MRESFIIGTAGHIDHGKTTLIRALTGNQGDRLREEKERGITIDLGFTHMVLDNGELAGIIDVPGHERFLKNMLSGATSISIVLLVIAADEGIMPQTSEHFSILRFLGMKRVAAVLTKSDKVDDDILSARRSEVRDFLSSNGYGDSEIFAVSSISGQGIGQLKKWINDSYDSLEKGDNPEEPFRLNIDRVFNSKGFGTVVTGTVMEGTVNQGDTLDLLTPSEVLSVKVRGIQVHGAESTAAAKGQRCAINLARTDASRIRRGDTLAMQGLVSGSSIIDCTFIMADADARPKDRDRVRLYLGTREILGRIHFLPDDIHPGMVQFRLEEPAYVLRGDRYVARSYSPMHLLGGGEIIDPSARKYKASKSMEHMDHLFKVTSGDSYGAFLSTLEASHAGMADMSDAIRLGGEHLVEKGKANGDLAEIEGKVVTSSFISRTLEETRARMEEYFSRSHLGIRAGKEEIRLRLSVPPDRKVFQAILKLSDNIIDSGDSLSLRGRTIVLDDPESALAHRMLSYLGETPFSPPDLKSITLSQKEKRIFESVASYLVETGDILILDGIYFTSAAMESAQRKITGILSSKGPVSIAEVRELLQTSRKYAVPILEHLDDLGVTRRSGDRRILR
ncbi:selenocysteine-specific translation elongation factor [Youngiibacter fragilis]|uniref:Selenocysteine-specific elongation factor n=1 Tax=Youngiibacter fragilis 232.1 TaxID=994573 RepID=V7I531_9CLOT|nr:selenocysteine-specific translation elongation factor [Youngiibacter fragilis]ETA80988.1 translation elongation factor [Youngiibacter fragilis 232.1]